MSVCPWPAAHELLFETLDALGNGGLEFSLRSQGEPVVVTCLVTAIRFAANRDPSTFRHPFGAQDLL